MSNDARRTAMVVTARNGLLRKLTNAELRFVYRIFTTGRYKAAEVHLWSKTKTQPRNVCVSDWTAER
jgi:hypothetical protein